MISLVQDFYPEIIHHVNIFNAPSMFSKVFERSCKPPIPCLNPEPQPNFTRFVLALQIFAVFSGLFNERMLAKLAVVPLGGTFAEIAQRIDARAIHSWCSEVSSLSPLEWSDITVASGACEFCSRWLQACIAFLIWHTTFLIWHTAFLIWHTTFLIWCTAFLIWHIAFLSRLALGRAAAALDGNAAQRLRRPEGSLSVCARGERRAMRGVRRASDGLIRGRAHRVGWGVCRKNEWRLLALPR